MKIAVIDDSNNIVNKYQHITYGDYSRRQISVDDCLATRFAFYRFIKDLSTTYEPYEHHEEGVYIKYKGISTLYGTSDDDDDNAAHLYSKDNIIYPVVFIYPTNATITFLTTMRQALQQMPSPLSYRRYHHSHSHNNDNNIEEDDSTIIVLPPTDARVSSVIMHR
jgi:hypothetical protein